MYDINSQTFSTCVLKVEIVKIMQFVFIQHKKNPWNTLNLDFFFNSMIATISVTQSGEIIISIHQEKM